MDGTEFNNIAASRSRSKIAHHSTSPSNAKSAPKVEVASRPDSASLRPQERPSSQADEENQLITLSDTKLNDKLVGWKRMVFLLIIEAIAIGTLGQPAAFAALGLICGLLVNSLSFYTAMWAAYMTGQVKLRYPHVRYYPEAMKLVCGRWGHNIALCMFCGFMVTLTGSHVLTGTIMFQSLSDSSGTCVQIWGMASAIILLVFALPPTFSDFSLMGYIDFASILGAVLTILGGSLITSSNAPSGLDAVDWSLWPREGLTFHEAILAVTNIVFAYGFHAFMFSFMNDMRHPEHYMKSVWCLGVMEYVLYVVPGGLTYIFVGSEALAPSLLSATPRISQIAFGIAFPVIFISGSINTNVLASYVRETNKFPAMYSLRFWLYWIGLVSLITVIGWFLAEVIPFFDALLGLMSSVFVSGFTFWFPSLFWFSLLKDGKWHASRQNIALSIWHASMLAIGAFLTAVGVYASIRNIITGYNSGNMHKPFSCESALQLPE